MRNVKSRFLAAILVLILSFGLVTQPIMGAIDTTVQYAEEITFEHIDMPYTPVDFSNMSILCEDDMFFDPMAQEMLESMLMGDTFSHIELATLTFTLGTPLGAVGFEDVDLSNPNSLVDITVEFVTPSAVALRLMQERGILPVPFMSVSHSEMALTAHADFSEQLAGITGLARHGIQILDEHYHLFNGAFLRVPAWMISEIAALPEVFLVSPITEFETLNLPPWDTNVVSDAFMRETLDLFDIEYIRDEMDLWGRGIRVAVLDTGIDYNHPVFLPFNYPTPGYFRGWDFVDNRQSPMEATFNQWYNMPNRPASPNAAGRDFWTTHGTHVAGSIVAIAPGIEMSHYRVLGPFGTGSALTTSSALTRVHQAGYDIVNMSLGGTASRQPWAPDVRMVNLMVMDGITMVIAGGNHVHLGDFSILNPGLAPLAITVGAGHRGGLLSPWYVADIDGNTILAEVHGWHPDHTFANNLHGIDGLSPNYDGSFNFIYFGLSPSVANIPSEGLENTVAVFRRGETTFADMRIFATTHNAGAVLIVNNQGDVVRFSSALGGIQEANAMPILLASQNQGTIFTTVGQTGIINFGNANHTQMPETDTVTSFSSIGPIAHTFHIKPDIIAPGFMVNSTYPAFAIPPNYINDDWENAYSFESGTSMAAPIIAGVAALILEQNPNATPLEIKSRIMNTAEHMHAGNNSVFAVGAGFVDPVAALRQDAFATVIHNVYGLHDGDTMANPNPLPTGMASLSFGIFRGETLSRDIEVIVNNANGPWSYNITYIIPGLVGSLSVIDSNFNSAENTYTMTLRMAFNDNMERGLHQGHIEFTRSGERITMPFAGNFMGELVITPRPESGILRPIIALNAVADEFGDPRTNTGVSQASWVTVGFNDTWGMNRAADFFSRRVDTDTWESYGSAIYHVSQNNIPSNTDHLLTSTLSTAAAQVQGLLSPGIYRFYMHVRVDGAPWGDYFAIGEYIITDTRPILQLDDDLFEFEPSQTSVPITGQIISWGHDLAIEHGITTIAYEDAYGNNPVFGYSFVRYHFGVNPPTNANFNNNPNFGSTPNADGTFSFNVNTGTATIRNPIVLTGHAREANVVQEQTILVITLTTLAGTLRSPDTQIRLTPPWPVIEDLNWYDNELFIAFEDDNTPVNLLVSADFAFEYYVDDPNNRAQIDATSFRHITGEREVAFTFDQLQSILSSQTSDVITAFSDITITLIVIYRNEEHRIQITIADNNYITITPSAATVIQGNTQQFNTEIFVLTAPNISQDVIWSLYGNVSAATNISAAGLLTVGADEPRDTTFDVIATSVADSSLVATAVVTVQHRPSNDATLGDLSVLGRTLSPEFSPAVLQYRVTVPYETYSVTINYTTNQYMATATGAGMRNLVLGYNTFQILVTAENGTTITYTIVVYRQQSVEIPPMLPEIRGDNFIIWESFGGERGTFPFMRPSRLTGGVAALAQTPAQTNISVLDFNESNTYDSTAFMGETSLRWEIDFSQISAPNVHSAGLGVVQANEEYRRIPQLEIAGAYRNPTSIGMWIRTEGSDLVDIRGLFIGIGVTAPDSAGLNNWRGFTPTNQPLAVAANQAPMRTIYANDDWTFVEFFLDTAANHSMLSALGASSISAAQHAGPMWFPQTNNAIGNAADSFIGLFHGTAPGTGGAHLQNPNRPNQPVAMFIDGLTFFYNYDENGVAIFESTGLFDEISRPEISFDHVGNYVIVTVYDSVFGIDMDSLSLLLGGEELAGTENVTIAGNTITISTAGMEIGINDLRIEISNQLRFRTIENTTIEVTSGDVQPITGDNFIIWSNLEATRGTPPFFQPSRLAGPAIANAATPAQTSIAQIGTNESNTEDSTTFMGIQALQWDIDFSQIASPLVHSAGIGPGYSGTRIPQLNDRNPTSIGMWVRVEGSDLVDLNRMFVGVSSNPAPTAMQALSAWRGFTLTNTLISPPKTLSQDDGWVYIEFFLNTAANHAIVNGFGGMATFTPAQQAGPLYFPFMPAAIASNTSSVDSFFGFSHGVAMGSTPQTGQFANPYRPNQPVTMFIDGLTFFYNYDEGGAPLFESTGLFDNVSRPEIEIAEQDSIITITITGGDEHFAIDPASLGLTLNGECIVYASFVTIAGDVISIDDNAVDEGDIIRIEVANNLGFRTITIHTIEAPVDYPNLYGFTVLGVDAVEGEYDHWSAELPYGTILADITVADFVVTVAQDDTYIVNYVNVGEGTWTITVTNDAGNYVVFSVTLTVAPPTPVAPTITGPLTMSLTVGYEATYSEPFTITGFPVPEISLDISGDGNYDALFIWDAIANRLDILPSLARGTYTIIITATNAEGYATHTFILTIECPDYCDCPICEPGCPPYCDCLICEPGCPPYCDCQICEPGCPPYCDCPICEPGCPPYCDCPICEPGCPPYCDCPICEPGCPPYCDCPICEPGCPPYCNCPICEPGCPPYCDCPICEPACPPYCDCPACAYLAWREEIRLAQIAYEAYLAWLEEVRQAEEAYQAYRAWLEEIRLAEEAYQAYRAWLEEIRLAEEAYREWREWLCATGQCGGCHLCD